MQTINVMALFCEDIREEKGDIFSLIGLMPDNVNLADKTDGVTREGQARKLLGKLCLFVRINFDPDIDIGAPEIKLVMPDGESIAIGEIEHSLIQKSISETKENGNLLAGVMSRAVFWGFNPPTDGSIKVEVYINGETYLAGALKFKSSE